MKELLIVGTAICASYFVSSIILYLTTDSLRNMESLQLMKEFGLIFSFSWKEKIKLKLFNIFKGSILVAGICTFIGVVIICALKMP